MSGNNLQARLHALIEERYPRGGLNSPQVLRLGMIKLLEEATELAGSIALPRTLSGSINVLADDARWHFRNRRWLGSPDRWTQQQPSADALDAFKSELIDLYIVILHLAEEHARLTGEAWDIEIAALAKATAALARA